jgi:putative transposase
MILSEKHTIKKGTLQWKECDRICFASKNLYNYALYQVKQHYDNTGEYLDYYKLVKRLSEQKQVDYVGLPTKVSQQTLMILDKNYKGYFASLKSFKVNPSKFKGLPKPPKFLNILEGRFIAVYTQQAISRDPKNFGYAVPSQTTLKIPTKRQIQQVRIVPMNNKNYKVEILYNVSEPPLIVDNGRYVGIDLGVNNLATVVSNTKALKPFIINGKPLKSINQFYNKKKAEIQSKLPLYTNKKGEIVQKQSSKKLRKLTTKKNHKTSDYLHKSSRKVVNILKQNHISKVVIGHNNSWKNESNMNTQNNQNFVSIPHSEFIKYLTYKLLLEGITLIDREEAHTSKCSFLDKETIRHHEKYLGKRTSRGMFKSAKGIKINADCNGAGNILRKEISNAFEANGIEGVLVHPEVIKPNGFIPKNVKS